MNWTLKVEEFFFFFSIDNNLTNTAAINGMSDICVALLDKGIANDDNLSEFENNAQQVRE